MKFNKSVLMILVLIMTLLGMTLSVAAAESSVELKAIKSIVEEKVMLQISAVADEDTTYGGIQFTYEYDSKSNNMSKNADVESPLGNAIGNYAESQKRVTLDTGDLVKIEAQSPIFTLNYGVDEFKLNTEYEYSIIFEAAYNEKFAPYSWANSKLSVIYAEYEVEFNAPDADVAIPDDQAYQVVIRNNKADVPHNPKRTGYTFAGWKSVEGEASPDADITQKTVFEAQWEKNQYSVTFVDEDGTILKEATKYDYGTKAEDVEKPADPTKASTAEYTYTFKGWYPEVTDVIKNATYKATYSKEKNKYTVTWKEKADEEEAVKIGTTEVEYGAAPAHETPSKTDPTGEFVYTFVGWTDENGKEVTLSDETVTGDTSYIAVFSKEKTGFQIIVEDWTNEQAQINGIDPEKFYTKGQTVTFTVSADLATALAIHTNGSKYKSTDGDFARLNAVSTDNGTYTFEVTIPEKDMYLTLAHKGDTDLDAKISLEDSTMIRQAIVELYTLNNLQKFAGDTNADGDNSLVDSTMIRQSIVELYTIPWDL